MHNQNHAKLWNTLHSYMFLFISLSRSHAKVRYNNEKSKTLFWRFNVNLLNSSVLCSVISPHPNIYCIQNGKGNVFVSVVVVVVVILQHTHTHQRRYHTDSNSSTYSFNILIEFCLRWNTNNKIIIIIIMERR